MARRKTRAEKWEDAQRRLGVADGDALWPYFLLVRRAYEASDRQAERGFAKEIGFLGPEIDLDTEERIVSERRRGLTYAAIAAGLNADGVTPPRGGRWTAENGTLPNVCARAGLTRSSSDEGFVLGRPTVSPSTVRRIVEDWTAGLGASQIAQRLIDAGVPTARGGQWRGVRVAEILRRNLGLWSIRDLDARAAAEAYLARTA